MDPRSAVDAAFDDLRRHLVDHAPTAATRLGDHARDGDLDDWSPDSVDARAGELDALALRLGAIAASDAETDGDRVLLTDTVDALRFDLQGRRAHATDPLHYLDIATGGVDDLLRRDDLPPEPRRAAAVSRTAQVPRLLDQARRLLDEVPAPHREVALRRMPGTVELFEQVVPAFAPEAAAAAEHAVDACRAFAAWLEEGAGGPAPDWRLGEARWGDALRLALGVRMAPGEVWERATARLEELRAEAAELAGAVLDGAGASADHDDPVRAALAVAAEDRPAPGALVETAGAVLDEVVAFLRTADLVTLPDGTELRVREMPAYQQGVAVAFFVPAPPLEDTGDTASAPHTYYLSPIPPDWTAAQADSFLREYNVHALRSVGVHEAYPGHFVQFATAAHHPRLLRRTLWNSAFAEGWAVYAEREVIAAGYGGVDADRLRLTNVKMDLRAVANALLDQGLHVAGWDDETALTLLRDRTYQEASEAAGKLVRGKVTAGQLSTYFVGGEEMADLRRDAEAAQGSAFSVRAFHDAVLAHGTPPFPVLRRALLGEPQPVIT